MISHRAIVCMYPFALAGCNIAGPPDQSSSEAGQSSAPRPSFSAAERTLLGGGASQADVLAARAFVLPFFRTDQATCFGSPDLARANFEDRQDEPGRTALVRVAIAVDGSGSMAGCLGSRTKLGLARDATLSFIDGLPEGVPASLTIFGQQGNNSERGKARSCAGIDVLVPTSPDKGKLKSAVSQLRAVGWTPLAAGLGAAQKQLAASSVPGAQIIYIVSDGVETCGGDPVAVARDINKGNTHAIVNIIGFGLPSGETATLQSVAGAGGGRFINVHDEGGYAQAMAGIREEMRLSRNRVGANFAKAGNRISAGASTTQAALCTGEIISRESHDALAEYDARQTKGDTLPPRYQVVALLKERQDVLSKRRDAYAKRLETKRDAADAKVEADRKAAQ